MAPWRRGRSVLLSAMTGCYLTVVFETAATRSNSSAGSRLSEKAEISLQSYTEGIMLLEI